ncbi:hypothetical protein KR100_06765 [Synechococcus sp. KORDI-100]|nr:hypothetical protein KR100_06765 [Synechococcus sp. KORDI-100]
MLIIHLKEGSIHSGAGNPYRCHPRWLARLHRCLGSAPITTINL